MPTRKLHTLVLVLATVIGCTSSAAGQQRPATAAAVPAPPGGAALYQARCGRCHIAHAPESRSKQEWPGTVRAMRSFAALTAEEEEAIIAYLQSRAPDVPAEAVAHQPDLGGYLYTEYFASEAEISGFDLHYLAVYMSGWASEDIYWFGEFELEHGGVGGDNTFVEQAYLDYWIRPHLGVRIGAMLTPFNRFDDFHDPLGNRLVSRAIGVSAWKDVGVDVHGVLALGGGVRLGYDLYAINGLGSGSDLRSSRQYRDNNEEPGLGTRVSLLGAAGLEVGASLYRGAWDDAGRHLLQLQGAHLLWTTRLVDVHAEYAAATSENPAPAADGEMEGWFVQLSRPLTDRLRATVRAGGLDYLDPGDTLGRDIADGDRQLDELVVGLGWYPVPEVVFKMEYALFREGDRIPSVDDDRLGLQAAVVF